MLAAALLLLAAALWACLRPPLDEPALLLRDDAYYTFQWARNVAYGYGPIVSDSTWTSGIQILWGLLLVPVVWLAGPDALPHHAMSLGLVLHVATALLLAAAGRFRPAAWAVALIHGTNPFLLREAQNGQETALACLLLLALWLARRAAEGTFLLLGALLVLGRVDLWGFVLALSVWRRGARGLRSAGLVLLPWLGANLLCGGTLLPHSGAPMPWQVWDAFLATQPGLAEWLHRLWWYLRPVLLGGPWQETQAFGLGVLLFLLLRPRWPQALRALPVVAVAAAVASGRSHLVVPAVTAALLALLPRGARRPVRGDLLALLVGSLGLLLLHYGLRQYPRAYYFAPLGVVGAVALLQVHRLRWLLLLALPATLLLSAPQDPVLAGQQEMAMAGRFLREVLPPGERVGCFNSGIVTWHHARGPEAGTVWNLDGVVEPAAFAALRQRRLAAWLDQEGVRFVLDNPGQFERAARVHACGRHFGADFDAGRDLVPVCAFDVPGVDAGRPGTGAFVLYWRRGRGEAPAQPDAARDLGPGPAGGRYVLWPATAGADLWAEQDGTRRELVHAAAGCAQVVFVPRLGPGAVTLRTSAQPEPVLVLSPL